MKNTFNYVQMFFTALGGYIGYFLGGVDGFMYALIIFVVVRLVSK